MIDTSQLTLQDLVIHHVGNRNQGEQVRFSKKPVVLEEENPVTDFLVQYFFKPFKTEAYYNFTEAENGMPNKMQEIATRIFENPDLLFIISIPC